MKEKGYHYKIWNEEQIQKKKQEDESYERIKSLLFYWAKNNQEEPVPKIKRIERVEIDRNFDL